MQYNSRIEHFAGGRIAEKIALVSGDSPAIIASQTLAYVQP